MEKIQNDRGNRKDYVSLEDIKNKLSVYDYYDDGTNVYWIFEGHIYYLSRHRYYELRDYYQRYFSKIEDERRRTKLILENLSINAYLLERNTPKISVSYHKGHPVYKIEGEMEDEEFITEKESILSPIVWKEKEEKNPFLRRTLDYARKMVKKLREGFTP